ncbi:MAG: tripartite tricarboxylate transporter substrate binding protein BugD [Hyphomicrobiaceae bacterium]|nr:tripartite tricarboxylate transporter substrate binding protein BugD [Hyphomicrobiaceae bacterium]
MTFDSLWTRRRLVSAAAAAAVLAVPAIALAQDYPTKPITMVVPFAAGGPTDTVARLLGEHMGRTLGQQIVVENVAGAGGTTGTERVSKAEPDGYTVLLHHQGITAAPALYNNLRYDTKTALEMVGMINHGPMVVVGKKGLQAASAKELFDWMKQNADKITMAHAGVGSNSHVCGLIIQKVLGQKFTFVAYRGTGPAMNDLVAGQIDVLCDQSTNAVPQIQGGTVKAYAVADKARIDSIKDVPTAPEAGFPDMTMRLWNAIYAPKGTPKEIVAKVNAALRKALADPSIKEKFAAVGTSLFPESEWTPEAHHKTFLAELERQAVLLADK